jgi:hypothetical protein
LSLAIPPVIFRVSDNLQAIIRALEGFGEGKEQVDASPAMGLASNHQPENSAISNSRAGYGCNHSFRSSQVDFEFLSRSSIIRT